MSNYFQAYDAIFLIPIALFLWLFIIRPIMNHRKEETRRKNAILSHFHSTPEGRNVMINDEIERIGSSQDQTMIMLKRFPYLLVCDADEYPKACLGRYGDNVTVTFVKNHEEVIKITDIVFTELASINN